MPTSNTAQPTATDADWPRWLPASAIAALIFVSFEPFADGSSVEGGNLVNQIGFLLIGAASIWMIATLSEVARTALLRPAWIALALVLLFAVARADDPASSFRAALFSAIVVLAGGTVLSALGSREDLGGWLVFTAGTTLAFCLVAVFLYPSVGVHDGSGYESQHAGLWRGVYAHKNIASYVTGAFVVFGLFAARAGRPIAGLAVAAVALLFTMQAGSKTVLGVLPAAIAIAWLASRFRNGLLRATIVTVPVAALMLATVGAALSPALNEILQSIAPGTTFTGRLDLWKFTAEQIAREPQGYGFESFWTTPRVTGLEQPIELSWDVRKIVHGHNSYLDAIIAFGRWGALVVFWIVLVRPVWHFANLPAARDGMAGRLAQFHVTLWLFCAMGACLESFFLRRADPVWFTMVLALFGLQIAYRRTRA